MKSQSKILFFVAAITVVLAGRVPGQSTFQNLNFEAAQNIPVFDPQGHPWTMPAADALPGWTVYLGATQSASVFYNDVALDSAAVGIQSTTSPYAPAGFLVGQYCLSLQYGVTAGGAQPIFGTASIAQSAQLPSDVESIMFRGTFPFSVTFSGFAIPLTVLSSQAGYSIYAGDIGQFAGQTGELRITSSSHFSYLDAIQFSAQAIPEPNTLALSVVGLGLLCWRWRKWMTRTE